MKKATLTFNNIRLKPSQTHKLRGYVGNVFKQHDLIHNHDPVTGRHIYRYPLIQFKVIDKIPCIIALTESAVRIFTDIFMTMDEIVIENRVIRVHEKDLKVETVDFGYSEEVFLYELITPWLALNQKNHCAYKQAKTQRSKENLLIKILTGNILSMSKDLGLFLDKEQKIFSRVQLKEATANLKGQKMLGFSGMFKTNFLIPDYAGIGKAVSRGYGSVRRLL